MAGWYRCERQDCLKATDEEWAFILEEEDGTRRVYCSEECAKLDGMRWK